MRPEAGAGADKIIGTDVKRRPEDILGIFADFEDVALPAILFKCFFESQRHFFRVARDRGICDQASFAHFRLNQSLHLTMKPPAAAASSEFPDGRGGIRNAFVQMDWTAGLLHGGAGDVTDIQFSLIHRSAPLLIPIISYPEP